MGVPSKQALFTVPAVKPNALMTMNLTVFEFSCARMVSRRRVLVSLGAICYAALLLTAAHSLKGLVCAAGAARLAAALRCCL